LVSQICASLLKHGFRKLVILNGHGGNRAAIELIAQNAAESNPGRCIVAALSYWDISAEQIDAIRESPRGGMGHSCELETSLQLYTRGHLVRMERAVSNIQERNSEFEPLDLTDTKRGAFVYKAGGGGSSWHPGEIGIIGDPTLASAQKGQRFFEAITGQVVKLLRLIDSREP